MSHHNRNVRILPTIEMSGVMILSLLPLERLAPRMILRWTACLLVAILRPAVGRIGLRRSATRAPAGRLHVRGPGRSRIARVFACIVTDISLQCDKLSAPSARAEPRPVRRDLSVLQVMVP